MWRKRKAASRTLYYCELNWKSSHDQVFSSPTVMLSVVAQSFQKHTLWHRERRERLCDPTAASPLLSSRGPDSLPSSPDLIIFPSEAKANIGKHLAHFSTNPLPP